MAPPAFWGFLVGFVGWGSCFRLAEPIGEWLVPTHPRADATRGIVRLIVTIFLLLSRVAGPSAAVRPSAGRLCRHRPLLDDEIGPRRSHADGRGLPAWKWIHRPRRTHHRHRSGCHHAPRTVLPPRARAVGLNAQKGQGCGFLPPAPSAFVRPSLARFSLKTAVGSADGGLFGTADSLPSSRNQEPRVAPVQPQQTSGS
jgi:hypothetical protein